jgi:two-component system sensor histidine kinase/response regulator
MEGAASADRMQDPEHLRLVVGAVPIAIVVADPDGRITLINEQGERLFGYGRGELLGRSIEALVPERFRGGHAGLRHGYLHAPTTRPMGAGRDLYGLRRDGVEVPIEIGLNPLRTPEGEFILASVIDITERKHSEEMGLQRDRAVDASQLKSQFVATMSHELRTPLNAIIGTAELLSATALNERQRSFVETIDQSAVALLAIISSILDFSKIEAGKVDLETHDFELEAVVDGAAAMLAPQARDKGLLLHVYVDPGIPAALRGDQDRLRQILLNLIGNAVKFTPAGRVVVRALAAQTSARSAQVRFEVEDSGIGMDQETISKLFEPFVQADSSASRSYGGTGLGLSISKRLVKLMDGEIGVSSDLGSGAVFWFTVRFARGGVAAPARRVDGVRALVIAADEVFCDIVTRYAESWGMPATRVRDAAGVLDALRGPGADADGREAAGWTAIVDGDDETVAPAIDLLRAHPLFGPRRIIAVGRDARLSKPIRQSQLFDRIAEALGDGGAAPRNAPAAAAQDHAAAGKVLVVEDNASLREIMVHQFAELGVLAAFAADGVGAVDAVARERFALIFMDCHMPNMDGFAATRAIRAAEAAAGGHVPIVAMTANAFKEDREACLAAGMDDYLSKPLRMNDLRAMTRRWIGVAPGADALA